MSSEIKSRGGRQKLEFRSRIRIRHLIVAGFAAGLAIVQAILAKADLHERFAEAAVFFAVAAVFRHLALQAAVLPRGSSGHGRTVARRVGDGKVPLVTAARRRTSR